MLDPNYPVPQLTKTWLFLRFLNRSRHGRFWAMSVVAGMVAVIGTVDYLLGIGISLQVFYLIPVMLAASWLGWRSAGVVAIAGMMVRVLSDFLAGMEYSHPTSMVWNRLIDLSMSFLLVWVFHAMIELHRQLETRVKQRTLALQQALTAQAELQTQLFEISRRERSSIGRDLHDGLGQHLTATSMAADLLAERLNTQRNAAAADARVVVRLVQEGIGKTREIARGLLLAAIEPDQLIPELEELAASVTREQRINCHFTSRGAFLPQLDVSAASHLFYIAQEATRNAVRHGRASRVEIALEGEDHRVLLTVADNGTGLPTDGQKTRGMGLRIMDHRAKLIGGEFTIRPAPERGTLVQCQAPVNTASSVSVAT